VASILDKVDVHDAGDRLILFQIIIEGPTEDSVLARSEEFREKGALITRGPEIEDGIWKVYLDDTGARTGNMITS
jgi:hypothetical protein